MNGTTVCPHCDTRFKITKAQLEAHHGMVRCGRCLQAFDTHSNFISGQPGMQLELSTQNKSVASRISKTTVLQPMTLAEQVTIVQDDDDSEFKLEHPSWLWTTAVLLLMLMLLAQTTYFFRVELAARLPSLKPVLIGYCWILKCSIPLPQHTDLIGIESSELEADPTNENQITLNALLRNRASYAQAFPSLELTLNDSQDEPLARRMFKPAEYLPQTEKESSGLLPNHELSIKMHLNTTDLKPSGYRLAVFYSPS